MSSDITLELQETIQQAASTRNPLKIVGGNSKSFYGRLTQGQTLNVANHRGIINYEPSELVITARAGTPLQEISDTLSAHGQCLAFEPPHFGKTATLGGTIACGFSGPSRPYFGAARDFVLGVKCINGKGEILRFGGQVMKNVAGYDISRLMVGAMGTLGVLLEISCKVLPLPPEEVTLALPATLTSAVQQMIYWGNQTVPLTASCYDGSKLLLRLSGTSIQMAVQKIPGDVWPAGKSFWEDLREHRLAFFTRGSLPLWRLSVPILTPRLKLVGNPIVEWGGALRWFRSELPADNIRKAVTEAGGHATLFKGGDRQGAVFHPLPASLEKLQRRLKEQFDPYHILNPRKMTSQI